MVKNALLCLALVSTGVVGASLELGVSYALAADDCITESNLVPPKGSRWYYCRIFTPAQPEGPGASVRDYCSGVYNAACCCVRGAPWCRW